MKKVLVVVLSIAALIVLVMVAFNFQIERIKSKVAAECTNMTDIDLSTIPDGTYNGKSGSIPVNVDLDVNVKDHHIVSVTMKKQSSGKGYEAKDMTQRIVNSQKLKVDVVTGATLSSRCIIVATYNALKNAGK
jgi:uncharacterized protein with FMN-binding domain